jgi:hypothetical protein
LPLVATLLSGPFRSQGSLQGDRLRALPCAHPSSFSVALERRPRVGEHAFEISDDEVSSERGAGRIEESSPAVRGYAVRQSQSAEVDVAYEGQADWSVEAGGSRRRWREFLSGWWLPCWLLSGLRSGPGSWGRSGRPGAGSQRRQGKQSGGAAAHAACPPPLQRRATSWIRVSARSRPTTASSSFTGSETVEPVRATRIG